MTRTEVYQLRLTKAEKDELAARAREQRISMARLIRQKLNLDASLRGGVAGSTGGPDPSSAGSTPAPGMARPDLSQRINQLFNRGMTTRQAKRQAEAENDES